MVNITINGIDVSVAEGSTILDAARSIGIYIPTLCHLDLHDMKMVNAVSSCRVCMVELEGRKALVPSCSTRVSPGMKIKTDSKRAVKARRTVVELLLSNHPQDCLICPRNLTCELQKLAAELGIREIEFTGEKSHNEKDTSSCALVRNPDKCVLCRRCETVCNQVQTVGVYSAVDRGFETVIGTAFHRPMNETVCTFCGQCVSVCPTGALVEMDSTKKVWDALNDPNKYVVVQTAPAVRVALGEEFGMEPGTRVTGQMATALRRLGFDKVLDTDFAADLTIMEEATEFIHRLQHGGRLPILTSCCPAWVKFFEHHFPDLLDIPSSCKSPHEMLGRIIKTYLADKLGIDKEKLVVVSVMPCLAKKYEARRPELSQDGIQDVDLVVSTRELGRMIREAGMDLKVLEESDFDSPLGESTGASVIFGATGGVLEATLRTSYEWLTGKKLANVEFTQLRGLEGVVEATVDVDGTLVKVARASGLGNARKLLEAIRSGEGQYHAIEIMACPGGCIGGGGQPYHHGDINILKKRLAAIYDEDRSKNIRCSHDNPQIQQLYKEFLGEPYSEKAHELLHTSYFKREMN